MINIFYTLSLLGSLVKKLWVWVLYDSKLLFSHQINYTKMRAPSMDHDWYRRHA